AAAGRSASASTRATLGVLDAWSALEVLSPQTFNRPEDLGDGDAALVAEFDGKPLPWAGAPEVPKRNTRLYYHVVLGALRMDVTARSLLQAFGDSRAERPNVRGFAALAAVTVDAFGRPADGGAVTVSSFGWGYERIRAGALDSLDQWPEAQRELTHALTDRLVAVDGAGDVAPLDHECIAGAFDWLTQRLDLSPEQLSPPHFALRAYRWHVLEGPPEPPLLNSFFLQDLKQARKLVSNQSTGRALNCYLGAGRDEDSIDLLENRAALDRLVSPAAFPAARWPGRRGEALVLLQQAAVNLTFQTPVEGGIVAVNGPPGSGKTTLLRDLVAGVVLERAKAMSAFGDPRDAFEPRRNGRGDGGESTLFEVAAPLRGHEILVASTVNKAVENISVELPALDAIDPSLADTRYFRTVSDALAPEGRRTWGLIASVLGNAGNRSRFYTAFWREDDTSLRSYLLAAEGQVRRLWDRSPETGKREQRLPKVVSEESPPAGRQEALERWRNETATFRKLLARVEASVQELEAIREDIAGGSASTCASPFVGCPADAAFWRQPHTDLQTSAPWLSDTVQDLRDRLFVAAVAVHKAFIDAAATPVRHNLHALMGTFIGQPGPDARLGVLASLWSTLFIVTPVVSTTFASVWRMLGNLPVDSLGWLLIDEAGQTVPQAAVGAMMRAKRTLIVGDPLQIEPVVSLPDELVAETARAYGVNAQTWAAPGASCQTLADRASRYGAGIDRPDGRIRVGAPLVVHRRCAEPMFGISNRISYGGVMVQATPLRRSIVIDILGPSAWIDVHGAANGKWSVEEGHAVIDLFERLAAAGLEESPDVFVISPFREVAISLRRALLETPQLMERISSTPRAWVRDHVGTVHTFQGKEADVVIFVLGAQGPRHAGARRWAARPANLVNVAVTRARSALYVVGSRTDWFEHGCFAELSRCLPDATGPTGLLF
ncbi:MAG: DEAD/DEAH box helicase, partial [Gammaproteobacteria bacterium]